MQLAATAGESALDPLSYAVDPLAFSLPADLDPSTLRIGFTEDFGCCDVDSDIRAVFRARMAELARIVHTCEPVDFDFGDAHRCFDVIRAESFVAGLHAIYERDPSALGPNTRANYEMGAKMSLADGAWAHAEQTRIFQRFQRTFSKFDVIVSPVTPVSPFPWTDLYATTVEGRPQENYYRWLALTYVVTLTTNPALALPCGVDAAGMPFGLQIVGPFRGDLQTLRVSQALERAFAASPALRRPRPDLARLAEPNPALKSIVTAPPDLTAIEAGASGSSAV